MKPVFSLAALLFLAAACKKHHSEPLPATTTVTYQLTDSVFVFNSPLNNTAYYPGTLSRVISFEQDVNSSYLVHDQDTFKRPAGMTTAIFEKNDVTLYGHTYVHLSVIAATDSIKIDGYYQYGSSNYLQQVTYTGYRIP